MLETVRDLFKRNLIELRGDRKLKEVASGAGIPYSTYQRFEALDPNLPSDDHLAALANYFNVSISRFFRSSAESPSPQEALAVLADAIRAPKAAPDLAALGPDVLSRLASILASGDQDKVSALKHILSDFLAGFDLGSQPKQARLETEEQPAKTARKTGERR